MAIRLTKSPERIVALRVRKAEDPLDSAAFVVFFCLNVDKMGKV